MLCTWTVVTWRCCNVDLDQTIKVLNFKKNTQRSFKIVEFRKMQVQERSCCFSQLVKYLQKLQVKGAGVAEEINALFEEDLNPVSVKVIFKRH